MNLDFTVNVVTRSSFEVSGDFLGEQIGCGG
jgi:hypothetical protein